MKPHSAATLKSGGNSSPCMLYTLRLGVMEAHAGCSFLTALS